MNKDPMTIEEVEALLRASLKNAVAKEIKLIKRCYRSFNTDGAVVACCAIGAYLLDAPKSLQDHQTEAADRFGISYQNVSDITKGWDDDPFFEGISGSSWRIMGKRLREEFLTRSDA